MQAKPPVLWTMNNPSDKISPDQKIEIVRYVVDDWKKDSVREVFV